VRRFHRFLTFYWQRRKVRHADDVARLWVALYEDEDEHEDG